MVTVRRATATAGPTAVRAMAKVRAARGGVRMDRLADWSSGFASSSGGSMRWSESSARSAAIGGQMVALAVVPTADQGSAAPALRVPAWADVSSAGSAVGQALVADRD